MMDVYNLSTGAITAVGVSLLVIFSIVGLIIWSSRTKEQVKALKSINAKIQETAEVPAAEVIPLQEENPVQDDAQDGGAEVPEIEGKEIAFAEEAAAEPEPEIMDNNYNVGKSGKVYSKSELLQLIRS